MASSGTVRNVMSESSTVRCASPRARLATPVTVYPARASASESPLPTRPAPTKPSRSVSIRGVLALERTQQRRPLEQPIAAAGALRVALEMRIRRRFVIERDLHAAERFGGLLDHRCRRRMQRSVAREERHLDATRLLEPIDQVERLRHARRAHQQPVVTQDHGALVAKMRHQPALLATIEGRT